MAALFAVLLGLSSMLLGYFLYDFGRQNFIRETEAAIDSEMAHILATLEDEDAAFIQPYIAKKAAASPHPVYLYISSSGGILAGNIEQIPGDVVRIKEGIIGFQAMIHLQNTELAAKIHTFSDGSRLLIARDIGAIDHS